MVKCVVNASASSQGSKSYPVTFSSIEKGSEKSLQEAHEEDISFNCNNCNFECVRAESIIAHMSAGQEECLFCYSCGKYLDKETLKTHNITIHQEFQDMTESECEEIAHVTKDKKKVKKNNFFLS